jgi:hypothetical protein
MSEHIVYDEKCIEGGVLAAVGIAQERLINFRDYGSPKPEGHYRVMIEYCDHPMDDDD